MGGARTALYNWLWARKSGGTLILRIEDTDLARSQRRYAEQILESLSWLGLTWDELYFQSERLPLYRKYVDQLLDQGLAYPCFCTPAELEARRQRLLGRGEIPEYDGHCRNLSEADRRRRLEEGRQPAIRFRVPEEAKATSFHDVLRGEIQFKRLTTGDFVILKSDGTPTYNLACVVDDHLMEVSLVLRAEDHISNTPKQIWLYQALGWEPPQFGHLSLILGPDRHKLSKRHGATTVEELRAQGFLPEAVVNALALLGWSPGTGKEVFTLTELVEEFSLERVVVAPQVFDTTKLHWLNRKHLARLTAEELWARARPFLPHPPGIPEDRLKRAVVALRSAVSTLAEFASHPDFLSVMDRGPLSPEAQAELARPEAQAILKGFLRVLPDELKGEELRPLVRAVAAELGLQPAQVFHTLRLALIGRKQGLELAAVVDILGAQEVRQRVLAAVERGGPEG